jgi:UDP-glucose 4-epimerase
MPAKILLTGATGYITSHTWLALWHAGDGVVGLDNFSNSSRYVLGRLERIGGREPRFVEADDCDAHRLDRMRVDAWRWQQASPMGFDSSIPSTDP